MEGLGWLFLFVFGAGLFVGSVAAGMDRYVAASECRKQHNVYQCEVQYVPVKVGD